MLITSPTNPRVGRVKELHTAKGRKKSGLFLVEGLNLLEAILDADLVPYEVYYYPEYLQRTPRGRELLQRLLHTQSDEHLIEVNERVIEAISDAVTAQGIVSVLSLVAFEADKIRVQRTRHLAKMSSDAARETAIQRPVLLILDGISDPGNMGTILRTALAADVDTVLLTPNCVDCYSPKVVRAAVGTHMLLPIERDLSWAALAEKVQVHCAGHARVLLADSASTTLYYEQDLIRPFALLIGNEAHGPSVEAYALATTRVMIPLANAVESLNAAMATGVIVYEAMRQRGLVKLDI